MNGIYELLEQVHVRLKLNHFYTLSIYPILLKIYENS